MSLWGSWGRGAWRVAMAAAMAAGLGACTAGSFLGGLTGGGAPSAGPVAGETLGSGPVKVALLLPLSATGNAGDVARSLRNAADLAIREFPNAGIQVLVKDDRGTPDGARAAATQALGEGVTLILGPLFAQSVTAAASVARPANIPVVAFSTDTSVASRGVYLMGFLPQSDVERIIGYATRQGQRSIAALLPVNAYGTVVQATLQRTVANNGGRLVALETYDLDRGSMQEKAQALATVVKQGTVNAVFIPEGGENAVFIAQTLAANGVSSARVRFLGSSQWDNALVIRDPNVAGGWFPGPDNTAFVSFSQRYRAAFGTDPSRTASLAYDAVSLAAGLSTRFGAQAFTDKTLTTPSGFIGVDGAFRFLANGTNERALAVYQIEQGRLGVLQPAPRSFARSPTL